MTTARNFIAIDGGKAPHRAPPACPRCGRPYARHWRERAADRLVAFAVAACFVALGSMAAAAAYVASRYVHGIWDLLAWSVPATLLGAALIALAGRLADIARRPAKTRPAS